jgi:hypothetical protein
MYMGLLAGQGVGPAAQWVTVILFIEVARRAHKRLKRPEIFVLFYMAGAAMATPFSGLLWNQFFVTSQAARSAGVAEYLPTWFAPQDVLGENGQRTFFQLKWLPAIGLIVFSTVIGRINNMVLGYGLFRVASDVVMPWSRITSSSGRAGTAAVARAYRRRTMCPTMWNDVLYAGNKCPRLSGRVSVSTMAISTHFQ